MNSTQETNNLMWEVQKENTKRVSQNISTDILRGKNVMEKYITPKGKERNSKTGALKANTIGTFKSQKTIKMGSQWAKTKLKLPSTDVSNILDVHDTGQGKRSDGSWIPKPPDKESMLTISNNSQPEAQQNVSSSVRLEDIGIY